MACCNRNPYARVRRLVVRGRRGVKEEITPEWLTKRSNAVRTSKYGNCLSWALFSLLYQFKRAANIYFLMITILTFLPFSPKSPWSMAGTFGTVLIFSMLKELWEDCARVREDR